MIQCVPFLSFILQGKVHTCSCVHEFMHMSRHVGIHVPERGREKQKDGVEEADEEAIDLDI